jgi:hypothetical protein
MSTKSLSRRHVKPAPPAVSPGAAAILEQIVKRYGISLLPAQAAEVLHVEISTLAAWRCRKNGGPAWSKAGANVIYPATAIAEFIDRGTVRPMVESA